MKRRFEETGERIKAALGVPSKRTQSVALEIIQKLQQETILVHSIEPDSPRFMGLIPLTASDDIPDTTRHLVQTVACKAAPSKAVTDYLNRLLSKARSEQEIEWNEDWYQQKRIGFIQDEDGFFGLSLPRVTWRLPKSRTMPGIVGTAENNEDLLRMLQAIKTLIERDIGKQPGNSHKTL